MSGPHISDLPEMYAQYPAILALLETASEELKEELRDVGALLLVTERLYCYAAKAAREPGYKAEHIVNAAGEPRYDYRIHR